MLEYVYLDKEGVRQTIILTDEAEETKFRAHAPLEGFTILEVNPV